jgi:hypothetical protein
MDAGIPSLKSVSLDIGSTRPRSEKLHAFLEPHGNLTASLAHTLTVAASGRWAESEASWETASRGRTKKHARGIAWLRCVENSKYRVGLARLASLVAISDRSADAEALH